MMDATVCSHARVCQCTFACANGIASWICGKPASDRWLNDRVFPFEDKLTDDAVYASTTLACAEMLSLWYSILFGYVFLLQSMARAIVSAESVAISAVG